MGRTRTFKVYMLRAENTDKVYIGSTSLSLNRRLQRHHAGSTTTATQLLKYGKLSIELLEQTPTKEQLKHRELYHIMNLRENGCDVVNKNSPIRV